MHLSSTLPLNHTEYPKLCQLWMKQMIDQSFLLFHLPMSPFRYLGKNWPWKVGASWQWGTLTTCRGVEECLNFERPRRHIQISWHPLVRNVVFTFLGSYLSTCSQCYALLIIISVWSLDWLISLLPANQRTCGHLHIDLPQLTLKIHPSPTKWPSKKPKW